MTLGRITKLWLITTLIGSLLVTIFTQNYLFGSNDFIELFGVFLIASIITSIPSYIIVCYFQVNIEKSNNLKFSKKANYIILNIAVSIATIITGEIITGFEGIASGVIGTYTLVGVVIWLINFNANPEKAIDNDDSIIT